MTTTPAAQRARTLAARAGRVAQRNLRRLADGTGAPAPSPAAPPAPAPKVTEPRLSPVTALRENGFTVFRGLFPVDECANLALALKRESGIRDGVKYTKVDTSNFFPTARDLLLEGRITDAVRSALATDPRYLQVGDLHYLHDTAGWHRDSVHRAHDSSAAPDWNDGKYGVVKAILYMEADNAAMGIMAGSHLSPIEMDHDFVKSVEQRNGQIVIDADTDPNLRLTEQQKRLPLAWKAQVGDVLVFDERMYHAGRRVENGVVTGERQAPKFTLSMVFGADNHHSERLYSYFRYARKELHYRDLPDSLTAELANRDLVLSRGWSNYYRDNPEDLRHAYLRDEAQMEPLIKEFSQDPVASS
jgi:ectoine hydroxylase-related dioxygenase (phytanoyl-CoA dioxygenase family)